MSDDEVFDSKAWTECLEKIRKKWDQVEARKEFGAIVSAVVFGDIMDHFKQQEGPSGKWQSWSRIYSEHMAKIGKGGNLILQDTGTLRQSFTPTNWRASGEGITFFNNATTKSGFPYARAHDEGGPRLPKRSFMWLSQSGADKMVDIVERWLAEGL